MAAARRPAAAPQAKASGAKPQAVPATPMPPTSAAINVDVKGIAFETASVKLGGNDVRFTGRLSVSATARLENEEIPKGLSDKARPGWMGKRLRDQAAASLAASKPTGNARHVELKIGGEPAVAGPRRRSQLAAAVRRHQEVPCERALPRVSPGDP